MARLLYELLRKIFGRLYGDYLFDDYLGLHHISHTKNIRILFKASMGKRIMLIYYLYHKYYMEKTIKISLNFIWENIDLC